MAKPKSARLDNLKELAAEEVDRLTKDLLEDIRKLRYYSRKSYHTKEERQEIQVMNARERELDKLSNSRNDLVKAKMVEMEDKLRDLRLAHLASIISSPEVEVDIVRSFKSGAQGIRYRMEALLKDWVVED